MPDEIPLAFSDEHREFLLECDLRYGTEETQTTPEFDALRPAFRDENAAATRLERLPAEELAAERQTSVFPHHKFEVRDLLGRISATLPSGYVLDHERRMIVALRDKGKVIQLGTAMAVTGRGVGTSGPFLRVAFVTDRDKVAFCDVQSTDLADGGKTALQKLCEAGAFLICRPDILFDFLTKFRIEQKGLVPIEPGWDDARRHFCLVDGRVIAADEGSADVEIERIYSVDHAAVKRWKDSVAAHIAGNPFPAFVFFLSLAGALTRRLQLPSFCVNFAGNLAVTTRARGIMGHVWPAATALNWGEPAAEKRKRLAAQRDTLLLLQDLEVLQDNKLASASDEVLGHGGTVGLLAVSSSMRPAATILGDDRIGQERAARLRILDIEPPADIYPVLQEFRTSDRLARAMATAMQGHKGRIGPAFVRRLLDLGDDDLLDGFESARERLVHSHEIDQRVVSSEALLALECFSAVALAGHLASEADFIPLTAQLVDDLVDNVASGWFALNGKTNADSPDPFIEALRTWLGENARKSLVELNDVGQPVEPARPDPFGYQDAEFYYLSEEQLKKIFGPLGGLRRGVAALYASGFLQPGGERGSMQYRMGAGVQGRPRMYRCPRARFDGER